MTIIHETEVPEVEHPGRFMRWLANEGFITCKEFVGMCNSCFAG
jgi:hypothetical protein